MGVPTKATINLLAAHGLVAREQVFGVAGEEVSVVRKTCRKGRAVVKHKLICCSSSSLIYRCLESVVFGPVLKDLLLNFGERRAGYYAIGV